jgi:multidrug efflux pump subunit AcrB
MIAWFTRNGVAANLVMLILVIGGIASYLTVKRELFPQFSLDIVTIRVPYLGASPEEVEESVIIRIEEAIQSIDGIKEISSVAQEGYGSVTATVEKGYELALMRSRRFQSTPSALSLTNPLFPRRSSVFPYSETRVKGRSRRSPIGLETSW